MIFKHKISRRFFRKGLSISQWARDNEFIPCTVFLIVQAGGKKYRGIYGETGKKIHEALLRDGLITKKEAKEYLEMKDKKDWRRKSYLNIKTDKLDSISSLETETIEIKNQEGIEL